MLDLGFLKMILSVFLFLATAGGSNPVGTGRYPNPFHTHAGQS